MSGTCQRLDYMHCHLPRATLFGAHSKTAESKNCRHLRAESEKPMWHGGIATWKVFAHPESFCAYLGNPQLKDMPKAQISRWCGKCQDGLETFWMVLNFPVHDIMKSNQLVNKLTLSEKDCYIMLFYVAKTIYALF